MYRQIFTGNLVETATFQNIDEQKSVVNFTVAVNFSTDDVVFFPCSKWIKGKEQPKWLEYLTKGQKVLIESNYFKISTSEKDGKTYQNYKVFVDKLELIGGKKENHQNQEEHSSDDLPY